MGFMNSKKKTDPIPSPDSVQILGEALLETAQATDQTSLEVFELYTHVLKLKIYANGNNFCARLSKGYEAILSQL